MLTQEEWGSVLKAADERTAKRKLESIRQQMVSSPHLYAVALADEMSRRRALGGPNSAAREWSEGELREIRERAAEVARFLGGEE